MNMLVLIALFYRKNLVSAYYGETLPNDTFVEVKADIAFGNIIPERKAVVILYNPVTEEVFLYSGTMAFVSNPSSEGYGMYTNRFFFIGFLPTSTYELSFSLENYFIKTLKKKVLIRNGIVNEIPEIHFYPYDAVNFYSSLLGRHVSLSVEQYSLYPETVLFEGNRSVYVSYLQELNSKKMNDRFLRFK